MAVDLGASLAHVVLPPLIVPAVRPVPSSILSVPRLFDLDLARYQRWSGASLITVSPPVSTTFTSGVKTLEDGSKRLVSYSS